MPAATYRGYLNSIKYFENKVLLNSQDMHHDCGNRWKCLVQKDWMSVSHMIYIIYDVLYFSDCILCRKMFLFIALRLYSHYILLLTIDIMHCRQQYSHDGVCKYQCGPQCGGKHSNKIQILSFCIPIPWRNNTCFVVYFGHIICIALNGTLIAYIDVGKQFTYIMGPTTAMADHCGGEMQSTLSCFSSRLTAS